MYLTNKIVKRVREFQGNETLLDKIGTYMTFVVDHPFQSVFRFLLGIPAMYIVLAYFDYWDGQHLQYAFSIVFFMLEMIRISTPERAVYNWPINVFNNLLFHPLASYAYAITIPLDCISIAVKFIKNHIYNNQKVVRNNEIKVR